jgi:hypothetical protein
MRMYAKGKKSRLHLSEYGRKTLCGLLINEYKDWSRRAYSDPAPMCKKCGRSFDKKRDREG